jgi:rare lipoprotein A (peptidoglycan hydrolase)
MVRLACIVAVLVVPLLLSSGRTAARAVGAAPTGAPAHHAPARHLVVAQTVTVPSWVTPRAIAADFRASTTTTTTTTTTTLGPQPAVRIAPVAPVTTTTVARAPTTTVAPVTTTTTAAQSETGQASWYDAPAGTCASPNLPFGTTVTVTDLSNGRSTTCTVDDRQDPDTGRILDLSEATFSQLADPSVGVVEVRATW